MHPTYDPPPVSPEIVSEHILWLRRDTETTPMHVIKLVYLAHGWMLALHDVPLINEPVEAWRYGPVISSVYQRYKAYGGFPITSTSSDQSEKLDVRQEQIIKDTVEAYRSHGPWDLSEITHRKGSPWDTATRSFGLAGDIPDELIQRHYKRLAEA